MLLGIINLDQHVYLVQLDVTLALEEIVTNVRFAPLVTTSSLLTRQKAARCLVLMDTFKTLMIINAIHVQWNARPALDRAILNVKAVLVASILNRTLLYVQVVQQDAFHAHQLILAINVLTDITASPEEQHV